MYDILPPFRGCGVGWGGVGEPNLEQLHPSIRACLTQPGVASTTTGKGGVGGRRRNTDISTRKDPRGCEEMERERKQSVND